MLQPKKVKWRKQQKGRMRGKAYRGCNLDFGDYGLQAVDRARVTSRQIEAARVAMTRHVKRGGKVWIRVYPDKPVTKKPAETRMGKGKGNPEEWVAVVKPGRILYEMEGVPYKVAEEALRLAAHKLPMKTRLVTLPLDRFNAFSDGVFAIAITLLVLEITIPHAGESVLPALREQWPEFLGYYISFAFIGGIWIAHSGVTSS